MLGVVGIRALHRWRSLWSRPSSSVGFSVHPLADEGRTVVQGDALSLGGDEKANGLDVGQRDFIKIQNRWDTTRGNFCAHMRDVFRPHVTDEANRCPAFIQISDDPQSHERGRAAVRRRCNRQTCDDRVQSMTYRNVAC
jgi:hypothetical protein